MDDLVERLNRQRDDLLRFKLVAGDTVSNRVYSECVEAARIAADSMREAAVEIERLRKEVEHVTRYHETAVARVSELTAEVEALRATNAQLTAENDALYGSFMDGRTPPIDAAMKGPSDV